MMNQSILNQKYLFFILIITLAIFGLAYLGENQLLVITFSSLAIIFFLTARKYLLLLYFIMLVTNGLIFRNQFLFGIIGCDHLINIFTTFYLYNRTRNIRTSHTKLQKCANNLIWYLIVFTVYTAMKDAYFSIGQISYLNALLRSLNALFKYLPLVFTIKLFASENKLVINEFIQYFYMSVLFQSIFCILSPTVSKAGLYYREIVEIESQSRFNGIFGNGDANSLGVFFVIAVSFFFIKEKRIWSTQYLLLLIPCLVCIALTGSRTAFISLLVFIALVVIKRKYKLSKKLLLLALLLLSFFISEPIWKVVTNRLSTASEQLDKRSTSNRYFKWMSYLQFIKDNPETIFRGNDKEHFVITFRSEKIFKAAHNFYIQTLYSAGIAFLLFLLYQIILLIKIRFKVSDLDFLLLPFLSLTMFVSDNGIFPLFSVYLSLVEEFS